MVHVNTNCISCFWQVAMCGSFTLAQQKGKGGGGEGDLRGVKEG